MFTEPGRELEYPLKNQLVIETETPDGYAPCGLPVFPEDSDEKITVLFNLSLNEFVALASAIDVGSDIAFGEDGLKVWLLWQGSVMCASFCEQMATCISEGDEDVINALAEALRSNPALIAAVSDSVAAGSTWLPGQTTTTAQRSADNLPPNVKDGDECIKNALWGACLGLVQEVNRYITDFFEQIEAASDTLETAAILAEAIPAVGTAAAAAAQLADQIQETLADQYFAAYGLDYENGLACELFCLALEDCALTIDQIINVFEVRVGSITFEDFAAFAVYAAGGDFSGDQVADIAFYMFFEAFKFGQSFAGLIGLKSLAVLMSLGADQLDSDNWESLCGDCAPVFDDYDFTIDEQGFAPLLTDYAVYHAGEGWGRGTLTTSGFFARAGIQADVGFYTALRFYFNEALTDGTSFVQALEYPYPGYTPVGAPVSGNGVEINVPEVNANGVGCDIGSSQPATNDIPSTWRITKLRVFR